MHWRAEGIVLAARRHGESALVAHVLTREHGRHAGLVHGGQGRRGRTVFQVGNAVALAWRARLSEHLGTFSGELVDAHAARVIGDPLRLACLAAAAAMAEAALPEREPHPHAFEGLAALLGALDRGAGWQPAYPRWELDLLAELGFGLDLARCAATGAEAELAFVSPRSGQAVARAAGEPYRGRLLPLPGFLLAARSVVPEPSRHDLLDALALTGFFWDRRVFGPQGRKLPPARARFVDLLARGATISSV